jgi:hypothetical protein
MILLSFIVYLNFVHPDLFHMYIYQQFASVHATALEIIPRGAVGAGSYSINSKSAKE